MRLASATFLMAHGLAHLLGVLTPWGHVHPPRSVTAQFTAGTLLPGGRTVGARALDRVASVIWLAIAIAFVASGAGFWRHADWAAPGVLLAASASLMMCILWWPVTRVGVVINTLLLLGVAIGLYR